MTTFKKLPTMSPRIPAMTLNVLEEDWRSSITYNCPEAGRLLQWPSGLLRTSEAWVSSAAVTTCPVPTTLAPRTD